jgi:hypothetical protein
MDFGEFPTGEVPRILLLGIAVHKPTAMSIKVDLYAIMDA